MVAEFFGNNDILAFQYATLVLLETAATMKHEKVPNGSAKQVFDKHKKTYDSGLDRLA